MIINKAILHILDLESGMSVFSQGELDLADEAAAISQKLALRVGKNHKIVTDTGIEISVPPAYFENAEFFKVVNNPDGTISIELKNIGKILNR